MRLHELAAFTSPPPTPASAAPSIFMSAVIREARHGSSPSPVSLSPYRDGELTAMRWEAAPDAPVRAGSLAGTPHTLVMMNGFDG